MFAAVRHSRPFLASLAFIAGICPLASAQSLRVTPFNVQVAFQRNSGTVINRSLEVTNVTTRVQVSTTIDGPANINWLFASPLTLNANEGAIRRVDLTILPAPLPAGTYTGTVRFTPDGGAAVLVVPVTLLVSDLRSQNAVPSALEFVVQRNSGRSAAIPVSLTSTSGSLSVSAFPQASPTAWLQCDPGPVNTPGSINTVVATGDLPPGDYTGSITLTATGNANESLGNPSVTIPVRMRIVDDSRLSVIPTTLTFDYQLNGTPPAARTVAVGTTGGPINFTVDVATPGTSIPWLAVTPLLGATPQNLSIGLQNPNNLPAGTFTGTATIKGSNGQNEVVTVTLRVATDPLLSVTPAQLTFTFQQGGSAAPRQVIVASNPGAATPLTVTPVGPTSQWLSVLTPTGTTPAAIVIGPNSTTLSTGIYDGAVQITGQFGNSPLIVPVRLVVGAANQPLLRVNQNQLNFAFQTGGQTTTLSRSLDVTSTGAAIQYSATSGGAGWLSVISQAAQVTPSSVTISVTPGSLPPGAYNSQVSIQTPEAGAVPIIVPVRMIISTQPLLSVSPPALTFNVTGSTSTLRQTVTVGSTGSNFAYQYSASIAGGGNWLVIPPGGSNTTGSTIDVGVNPVVTEGSGLVTISAAGVENSPVFVPVTLTSTGPTSQLTISPAQLDFVQTIGGAAPAAQTLDITLGQGAVLTGYRIGDIRYLVGNNWLKVSKTAGIAPDKVDVSVDTANLTAGRYVATIPFVSDAGNKDLVVILEIRPRAVSTFTAAPETLTFAFTPGGSNPAPQTLQVGSSGEAIAFTAEARVAAGASSWLTLNATSGTTPTQLTVSVNPSGLPAGTHQGTINLTSAGGAAPRSINVTLNIAAVAAPAITRVVNAASYLDVAAVPGMIVSLVGSGLGPTNGVAASPNAAGIYERQLNNVKVTFDGLEAPVLFVFNSQINAIVPYAVATRLSVRVQVEVNGVRSNTIELRVGAAAPGIFLLTAAGQGAILNQDGSVNGAANAAARDSVIVIYATGEGQTDPQGVDGTIPGRSTTLKKPVQRVRVRIGGQEAEVQYAGSAPFLVSGAMQVNAKVPSTVAVGAAVPIEVIVGDVTSAAGVTVAIR